MKKTAATIMSFVMVITLFTGLSFVNTRADDNITLNSWSFEQGGEYNPESEDDEGYITSVKLTDTDEVLSGYLDKGDESVNQTKTATGISTGFELNIANTGKDFMAFDNDGNYLNPQRINPWSILASMEGISIKPHHRYTVSFKAHATKNKYGFVYFDFEHNGDNVLQGNILEGSSQIIQLTTEDKEYSYEFENYSEAARMNIYLFFGAFMAQYDWDGNDISDIISETEACWNGTVYVSDFTITEAPPWHLPPTTTIRTEVTTVEKTTPHTTTQKIGSNETKTIAPIVRAKIKLKKVVSVKSKRVSVKWRKNKSVSGYQLQFCRKRNFKKIVYTKHYKKNKTAMKLSGLCGKKRYYVRIRAYKTVAGKKQYGVWSKIKGVIVKK